MRVCVHAHLQDAHHVVVIVRKNLTVPSLTAGIVELSHDARHLVGQRGHHVNWSASYALGRQYHLRAEYFFSSMKLTLSVPLCCSIESAVNSWGS